MFSWHERTRRLICRVVFIAVCLAPTAVVLGVGLWCMAPSHVRAEERWLTALLGVDVRLAGVRHLRPGAVLYEGVELLDAETAQPILTARLIEIGMAGDRVVIVPAQVELQAAQLARCGEIFERCVQRRADGEGAQIHLAECDLTLQDGPRSRTLSDFGAEVAYGAAGPTATLRFRLAAETADERAQLRIVRDRRTDPPGNEFHLQTGNAGLPCSLLARHVPALARLGAESRFAGHAWANQTAEGWRGEVSGHFTKLDLHRLVTSTFPHRLNGEGAASIEFARFAGSRIEQARGSFTAGPGVISRSLIASASQSLGLVTERTPPDPDALLEYQRTAFQFSIDASGLEITGLCDPPGSRVVMIDDVGPLLSEAPHQRVSTAALLRMLAPANDIQVPATRETEILMEWLPLPEIARRSTVDGAPSPPRGRLRTGD